TYLRYLGRLSIYTRTRMDYEHTISRLTPEQEEAVGAVKLRGHFLIRGGAGTGKSLVLLESLRRAAQQSELQFGEGEQAVLVTFTRTLAKYNRYISALRDMKIPLDVIDTIDSIFYTRLRRTTPDLQYDFEFLKKYLDTIELPGFISAEELAAEIEEYIFALDLKALEYVEGTVSRRGMRRTLTEAQRREIWKIAVDAALEMREKKIYTKNYGRLVLLRRLEAAEASGTADQDDEREEIPGDGRSEGSIGPPKIRYLFLDEVQDLTPVALRALRKLTAGPMIMAGDMGQSLYVYYSPFFRSGIDLRGSTRVLRTNFRNTRQIHELASRFRARAPRSAEGEPANPAVFRDGPMPELYTAGSEEDLLRQLCAKTRLFIEEMGYDPENICVLVPRRSEIDIIAAALEEEGLPSEDIRREEFSFANRGRVRISTLHSSKGLDFPVVMMYLPYLHRRRYYNPEETEKLLRNLIFVGLTRAMDNVNVFMTENDDPVLKDLREAFLASQ
ncbi:MAG: 3'-5' exonuclease, partial [Sediminispirochaetaceae bacterium]